MPQTFDISQTSHQQIQPSRSSGPPSRGTGTALDGYARSLFWIAIIVTGILLGYLLWGLFGNVWTNPAFKGLTSADQQRHLGNIAMVIQIMRISSIVAVVSVLICAFRDEGIGYILAATALILYAGMPFAAGMIFGMQTVTSSPATDSAIQGLQSLWWIYGVPGFFWVCGDFVRRFRLASEAAAIQRANLKYGSSAVRQGTSTNAQRFMGRCWELPYCRDHVRAKCPIYIRRRGPCWWYKEGCMCEERIVLQAVIANDWKQQTAAATGQKLQPVDMGMKPPADMGMRPPAPPPPPPGRPSMHLSAAPQKSVLSPSAKRDRCRKCIIYNEHQRQKYKLLVAITLITTPLLIYFNLGTLQAIMGAVLTKAEAVTSRFQLTSSSGQAAAQGSSDLVQDVLILCLVLVVLSQMLRLIEWLMFKVKI